MAQTAEKYNMSNDMSEYLMMRAERYEYEAEWREISDFLVPGRGIYQTMSKPRKRKLNTTKVINGMARSALRVLTSGLQGGLTSSSRPWIELEWKNRDLHSVPVLDNWLFESQRVLEDSLHRSNFYQTMHSLYTEVGAYGTGSIYVGSDGVDTPLRYELLTAGEYAFATDYRGQADKFWRTIFMTPRQMVQRFGKRVSYAIAQIVETGNAVEDSKYIAVLEVVKPQPFQDKPFTQIFWEIGGANRSYGDSNLMDTAKKNPNKPLGIYGFHEFPYPVSRWDVIGQDVYGMGPGAECLEEIKRLQQMEKGLMLATHKNINPPLNAPAYMRGKLQTLPGSYNYYRNPGEKIESIYNANFDYQGVGIVLERVEQRIKDIFFNDIFLTSARDPNASPMKAAEVHVKDGEKMLRLGPVIERMFSEFIEPTVSRSFNILLRAGEFPDLPPEFAQMAGEFNINLVSPLAQAQKLVASQSIDASLAFAGQASQYAPEVMDKYDIDKAVDEYNDAHGAPKSILRSQDEVDKIRADRQAEQKAQQQQQQQVAEGQMALQGGEMDANTQKTRAEAGQIMTESLIDQQSLGGLM